MRDEKRPDLVVLEGVALTGAVANPVIECESDPTTFTTSCEPLFIRSIGGEMVGMDFDGCADTAQRLRNPLAAQIAVKEEVSSLSCFS